MSKKDRMLEYINSNVGWFMDTSTYSVIPYYELSNSILNRFAQKCNFEIDKETVVCFISTSIMEIGNSGILFTTDYLYTKSWGGWLTSSYKYRLNAYDSCEFSIVTEFDKERMREMMSDLSDISREEDLKSIGETIGEIAIGLEQLLELGSLVTDHFVEKKQASLDEGLNLLMEDEDITEEIDEIDTCENTSLGLEIYQDLLDMSLELINYIINNEDDEYNNKMVYLTTSMLVELQKQIKKYMYYQSGADFDTLEEYSEYYYWMLFWGALFGQDEVFEELYPEDELSPIPQLWHIIIESSDRKGDVYFESIADCFSRTVLEQLGYMIEDETSEEEVEQAIRTNYQVLRKLYFAVERAKEAWGS